MVRLIKKSASLFLAIVVLFTIPFASSAYELDDVVYAAMEHIFKHEGTYDSILANDNGAVSLGKIAWHGPRALQLLKMIVEANPEKAKEILGTTLYNEVVDSELRDWNYRWFTTEECKIFKKLLATEESKTAQDKLSFEDVKGYITRAQSMGIKDGKALVFFADLENQMGSGGVTRVAESAIKTAGSGEKVTLKILYDAAMADKTASSSPNRRKSTYEYCQGLNFGDIETDKNYIIGKYKTTASSLRVRSGPGTNYSTIGYNLPEGTVVTVTEINGDWGKITHNGKTGWISLLYTTCLETDISKPVEKDTRYDVNGNGITDAADARITLRASAKMETLTESRKKLADFDGNGKITAADARGILRVAAKLN